MAEKKPSIKDVASRAGVSYTTVSHVINKTRYVSPEVEARVREAMSELNYRRNIIARSLRKSRSKVIGIIVPSLLYDFYVRVINGLEEELYKQHYNISLACSKEDPDVERSQIAMFASWQVDGIVVAPTGQSFAAANPGGLCDCPVVCIDRIPSDVATDSVETNCREVSREIVRVLVQKGHRDIAFATCRPDLYPSFERMEGYREVQREMCLPEREPYILNPTLEDGEHLAQSVLEQGKITALLIDNLELTVGALRYFSKTKVDIPGRMAVVGYDDSIWANVIAPPLTAVHQNAEEFGRQAARLLLDRIERPETNPRRLVLKGEVIWRATT